MNKEIARDLLGMASIPFYIIFIARAVIGEYMIFVHQLLIAAAVIALLGLLIKKADMYMARGLIMVVFSSLFYKDMRFTFFAAVMYFMLLFAVRYLKKDTFSMAKGLLLGGIGCIIAYFLAPMTVAL